jgi:hypothetical protein
MQMKHNIAEGMIGEGGSDSHRWAVSPMVSISPSRCNVVFDTTSGKFLRR